MKAPARSAERREIMVAARRYRRDGYAVSGPDEWPARPSFLGDLVPDLIAERDDDKVVIEVKRATGVRGSNDIIDLAERVAGQPGWRFELIAIPATAEIAPPDLARGHEEVHHLLENGFATPAFVVAYAIIEALAEHAWARNNRNPADMSFPAIVRDLVVSGVIGEDIRDRIDAARARRDMIVRGAEEAPAATDVEALVELGADMQRDIATAIAA